MKSLKSNVGKSNYSEMAYQPVELAAKLDLNGFELAMVKYLVREKGSRAEDLQKVRHYIELYFDLYQKKIFWRVKNCLFYHFAEREIDKFCDFQKVSNNKRELIHFILSRNLSELTKSISKDMLKAVEFEEGVLKW